jgi:hypothetical protein
VDELLGMDFAMHNILHADIGIEDAIHVLAKHDVHVQNNLEPTGNNTGETLVHYIFPKYLLLHPQATCCTWRTCTRGGGG